MNRAPVKLVCARLSIYLNNTSITRKCGRSVCRSETPRTNTRKLLPADDRYIIIPSATVTHAYSMCTWYRTTLNNAALHYHRFRERALTYYTRAAELLCYKPFLSLPQWNSAIPCEEEFIRYILIRRIIVITLIVTFSGYRDGGLYSPPCI